MEWECGECGEWVEPADANQDTCEECGTVKGQGGDWSPVREPCSSASIACSCGGVKITFASDAPVLAAECSCVDCRHRFNTFAARGGPTVPADVSNQDACLLMYYFQVRGGAGWGGGHKKEFATEGGRREGVVHTQENYLYKLWMLPPSTPPSTPPLTNTRKLLHRIASRYNRAVLTSSHSTGSR